MKNTIKIISLMLAALFALAICGCKNTESGNAELKKLFSDGYSVTMTSIKDETKMKVLLQKDWGYDSVYLFETDLSSEQYDIYNKISDSGDPDAALVEFLVSIKNATISDITNKVPAMDTLNDYLGKKFGDLETDGYESSGYIGEAGDYVFTYDGPLYCLKVTPIEGEMPDDLDDYSDNDIRALTIGAIEFSGFSFSFFDDVSGN